MELRQVVQCCAYLSKRSQIKPLSLARALVYAVSPGFSRFSRCGQGIKSHAATPQNLLHCEATRTARAALRLNVAVVMPVSHPSKYSLKINGLRFFSKF
jgi:hypothetical protein